MRFSVECAFSHLRKRGVGSRKSAFCGCDVTEKRSLARARRARLTEKRTLAASRGRTSRKGALWLGRHLQNASLREAPHQKAHSGGSGARRMRLSVTSNSRMRFSVECAFSHLRKRGVGSRKSAFCPDGLTEKRILRDRPHGKAHFGRAPGARLTKRRTLAGASPPECVST